MTDESNTELRELTSRIVEAYVQKNPVPAGDLPDLIAQVSGSISGLGQHAEPAQQPAVPVKKSVAKDHLICLEDGKKFKSLKRHIKSEHGLTPDEYRQKWGLSKDYPMVARSYSAARSEMAISMGLGRKPGQTAPASRKRK